jgi:hypothetical protein
MQHRTSIAMAKGEAIRVVKSRLEEAGITLPEPTYRLIGAEGLTVERPKGAARPALAAVPVEVQAVGAEETAALETLIEAEREALPGNDLLRREAPQE